MRSAPQYLSLKESVSRNFLPPFFSWFELIQAPDKQAKVFSNLLAISPRYSIRSQKSKNWTLWWSWHRRVKILGLANKKMCLQFFAFMIDVFISKRISPDCPFKSNQKLTKILILTPRCAVWLFRGGKHTESLTLRWDSHSRAFGEILITWLHSVMHTTELYSAVGYTPRSLTWRWDTHQGVCFVFYYIFQLRFIEVKKILKQFVT